MSTKNFAFASSLSNFCSQFVRNKPAAATSFSHASAVVWQHAKVRSASINMVASINILDTMTMDQFWAHADEAKVNAQYESDSKIAFLRNASFDEIKKVCIQYRYFVELYPRFLSLLVSKLPDGELRSLMAEILAEELGSGKSQGAHIVWYDNFLRSLGITDEDIETALYPENSQILAQIEELCHSKPYEYVVGMVGMGGECLCQIYLTAMHKYLSENKAMVALGNQVDWTFWTYHIGEEDIKHRELVRTAISNAAVDGTGVGNLFMGYSFGKSKWDRFWENNYKETTANV
eukprot:GFKZ01010811.1.p1 GENE.GFKZ01010811.1~~GFKZ01010811.1.p1  ORF type:complete len:291 (+),score=33.48 GFKZ01010811.1:192-1064(+)